MFPIAVFALQVITVHQWVQLLLLSVHLVNSVPRELKLVQIVLWELTILQLA
jgi:hypothetical protein